MNPKVTWSIVATIGAVIFALGVGLGFGLFPVLVDQKVADNLDLWNSESEGRKNFVSSDLEFITKIRKISLHTLGGATSAYLHEILHFQHH